MSLLISLKCAVAALFITFVCIYRPKASWKTGKEKSQSDMSALKRSLPWIQIGIAFLAVFGLYQNSDVGLVSGGLIIGVIGIIIIGSAKRTLGNCFSECTDMYVSDQVIDVGLYKYIRHPIYTGNMIFLLGISLAAKSVPLASIFIFFIYVYNKSARIEEAELTRKHSKYADYISKTGRFLPRIIR